MHIEFGILDAAIGDWDPLHYRLREHTTDMLETCYLCLSSDCFKMERCFIGLAGG